jgi:hypothetical protein
VRSIAVAAVMAEVVDFMAAVEGFTVAAVFMVAEGFAVEAISTATADFVVAVPFMAMGDSVAAAHSVVAEVSEGIQVFAAAQPITDHLVPGQVWLIAVV